MNIDNIGNIFTHASVCAVNDGIVIVYSHNDTGISQCLSGDAKDMFANIVDSCDSISFLMKDGNSLKIFIQGCNIDSESQYKMRPPISRPMTREDYDNICEDALNSNNKGEFMEFLDGAEYINEWVVECKLSEFIKIKDKEHENDPIRFESVCRWRNISESAVRLANSMRLWHSVVAPKLRCDDGYISVTVSDVSRRSTNIHGVNKELLVKSINSSDVVEIYCGINTNNWFTNIIFYA